MLRTKTKFFICFFEANSEKMETNFLENFEFNWLKKTNQLMKRHEQKKASQKEKHKERRRRLIFSSKVAY